ncbi:MAG: hypothetical protein GC179_10265 [Anaerolineaceae bacterium]|nr:hypothetical protein [Anaerolineaceae bacterium]
MTDTLQIIDPLTCPVCGGTGRETHTYRYKPQHRSDLNNEDIQRADVCRLCLGVGQVTQEVSDNWKQVQAYPVCPLCKGSGGKHFWTWDEGETGTRKSYLFEPCSLCQGETHIAPGELAVYNRDRRKLRFWGVGCTVVVVIGGLFTATQLVYLVMARTPWVQCCAPPHVVFVTGMIVLSRKMGWFQ